MKKFFITGFGPFSKYAINPSEEIAKDLSGSGISFSTLPVDYEDAKTIIEKIYFAERPDVFIHLGLAGTEKIKIELRAQNLMKAEIPDNSGHIKNGELITPGAPAELFTNFDVEKILKHLNNDNIYEASNDAGTYICNLVYYHSLTLTRGNSIFIHLPFFPGQSKKSAGMPKVEMVDAVKRIIENL